MRPFNPTALACGLAALLPAVVAAQAVSNAHLDARYPTARYQRAVAGAGVSQAGPATAADGQIEQAGVCGLHGLAGCAQCLSNQSRKRVRQTRGNVVPGTGLLGTDMGAYRQRGAYAAPGAYTDGVVGSMPAPPLAAAPPMDAPAVPRASGPQSGYSLDTGGSYSIHPVEVIGGGNSAGGCGTAGCTSCGAPGLIGAGTICEPGYRSTGCDCAPCPCPPDEVLSYYRCEHYGHYPELWRPWPAGHLKYRPVYGDSYYNRFRKQPQQGRARRDAERPPRRSPEVQRLMDEVGSDQLPLRTDALSPERELGLPPELLPEGAGPAGSREYRRPPELPDSSDAAEPLERPGLLPDTSYRRIQGRRREVAPVDYRGDGATLVLPADGR